MLSQLPTITNLLKKDINGALYVDSKAMPLPTIPTPTSPDNFASITKNAQGVVEIQEGSKLTNALQAINNLLSTQGQNVATLDRDVGALKVDDTQIKADIAKLKQDDTTINNALGTLSQDDATIKRDITNLKTTTNNLDDDVVRLQQDVADKLTSNGTTIAKGTDTIGDYVGLNEVGTDRAIYFYRTGDVVIKNTNGSMRIKPTGDVQIGNGRSFNATNIDATNIVGNYLTTSMIKNARILGTDSTGKVIPSSIF